MLLLLLQLLLLTRIFVKIASAAAVGVRKERGNLSGLSNLRQKDLDCDAASSVVTAAAAHTNLCERCVSRSDKTKESAST